MNKKMYICQLSNETQESIKNDIIKALSNIPWINLEDEVENAMNSKLCDLEDAININKYL